MYISSGSPTRSVRSTADGWTILGGEGHKVGHDDDTRQRYEALEEWAGQSFDVESIGYRWSAQDYETVDGLPYVGLSPGRSRSGSATGFRKWGMTNGTAAAMILSDRISGRSNPWAEAFDSTRLGARSLGPATRHRERGGGQALRRRPGAHAAPAAGRGAAAGRGRDRRARRRDGGRLPRRRGRAACRVCDLHPPRAAGSRSTLRSALGTAPATAPASTSKAHVLQGPAVKDLEPRT